MKIGLPVVQFTHYSGLFNRTKRSVIFFLFMIAFLNSSNVFSFFFISSSPLRLSGITVWIDASYSLTLYLEWFLWLCKGRKSEKYISLKEYLMTYLTHKTSWKISYIDMMIRHHLQLSNSHPSYKNAHLSSGLSLSLLPLLYF